MSDELERIRVLIVDDHEVVRRGLRGFLELQDDMEVVGEASDGAIAISLADSLEPDVVLMDLLMPNVDGSDGHRDDPPGPSEHRHRGGHLVPRGGQGDRARSRQAHPDTFSRTPARTRSADAIRAAFAGEVHLDPQVARVLAQRMRARRDEVPTEALTPRELEVLQLLARGAANKEIAADLSITERTARTHVSNILGKLGLASRTQAALWAVEHNMLDSA